MLQSVGDIKDNIQPLSLAAKSEAEKLGHQVTAVANLFPSLAGAAIGAASRTNGQQMQTNILEKTKTMAEAGLQMVYVSKESGGNPKSTEAHAKVEEAAKFFTDAAVELTELLEKAGAETGLIVGRWSFLFVPLPLSVNFYMYIYVIFFSFFLLFSLFCFFLSFPLSLSLLPLFSLYLLYLLPPFLLSFPPSLPPFLLSLPPSLPSSLLLLSPPPLSKVWLMILARLRLVSLRCQPERLKPSLNTRPKPLRPVAPSSLTLAT